MLRRNLLQFLSRNMYYTEIISLNYLCLKTYRKFMQLDLTMVYVNPFILGLHKNEHFHDLKMGFSCFNHKNIR